jgi:hypothetical protein
MARSDDVVITLPLTEETRGFVSEAAIAAMKPTGVLVNVGRGPVIDEPALVRALRESGSAARRSTSSSRSRSRRPPALRARQPAAVPPLRGQHAGLAGGRPCARSCGTSSASAAASGSRTSSTRRSATEA